MGFTDIFRISQIKADNNHLQSELHRVQDEMDALKKTHLQLKATFNEIGGGEALKLKEVTWAYEQQPEDYERSSMK